MKRYTKYLQLIATIGIYIFLFLKFDIKLSSIISDIKCGWYLLVGVFCRLVIVQTIAMNRWRIFLHCSNIEEDVWTLTKISFVSSFLGTILPSSQGGDMMRMYYIEKKHHFSKGESSTASSSVLVERMIGFFILALIGLVACSIIPNFDGKRHVLFIIIIINVSLWILIFIITNKKCYYKLSSLLTSKKRYSKILLFLEKTHHSLVVFPYRRVLLPSALLICALQITTITILYFVFCAFDISIPFYIHLAFYPIIAILSIIPISISGLGIREGFFVFFYSLVGVPSALAVKISLINYCTEVLSAAIMGGIIFGLVQFKVIKGIIE